MSDFKTLLAVGDLASPKISTVSASETVRGAARKMAEEKTDALLVLDAAGRLVGIVTEQDVVYRAVARDLDLDSPAEAIMTPGPLQIAHDESVFEAKKMMRENDAHHLVVVKDGRPVGMLSYRSVAGG